MHSDCCALMASHASHFHSMVRLLKIYQRKEASPVSDASSFVPEADFRQIIAIADIAFVCHAMRLLGRARL